MALYEEASESAALIAMSGSAAAASEPRTKFWKLYWGPMSLVEDASAKKAMETFGKVLGDFEGGAILAPALQNPSYQLAVKLRESLKNTWDRPFEFETLPSEMAEQKPVAPDPKARVR